MASKSTNTGKDVEDNFEPPWKFLAGLNPQDTRMMRRAMVKIYLGFNRQVVHPAENKFNYRVLSRAQRLRVNEMMKEAHTDNPLLLSMLTWFAKKHRAEDKVVLSASIAIRDNVTNFIRQPSSYREEYKKAVVTWKDFLFENEGIRLSEFEVEAMLLRVDHKTIVKKVLAQREKEEAGEVITEPSFAGDDDNAPTEDEEIEPEKKKQPRNIFTETDLSGSFKRTRSGKKFKSVAMTEEIELEMALEASRLEAEASRLKEEARNNKIKLKNDRRAAAIEEEMVNLQRRTAKTSISNTVTSKRDERLNRKRALEDLKKKRAEKAEKTVEDETAGGLGSALGGLHLDVKK